MITKRNGHGHTECRGCKNKGKYALNWDCFLYNFDNEPYCFDCLMEKLEQLQQENQELKKQLENNSKINVADHKYASTCEDKVIILETQQKEFIKYLEESKKIEKCKNYEDFLGIDDYIEHLKNKIDELNEILQKYKSIIGDKDE